MRLILWFVLLLGTAVVAVPASALTFSQGHGDLGMWYVPGRGYELMLSNGPSWQSDPASATILVGPRTRETVPASLATPGSGLTPEGPLWKLPQSATEAATDGAPWLGMQIHGGPLGSTAASAGPANMQLELVSSSGPGQLLMWQDLEANLYGLGGPGGPGFESRPDLLASPGAAFNSALDAGNHVGCWNHMHTHMNWGFTAPGDYNVTLNLSGETAEDGRFSSQATFHFLVEDQSIVPPRVGDLTGDGVINRADLAGLSQAFGTASGATLATGDLNSDGRVGLRDLILLRNTMGSDGIPTASEPSSSTWPSAAPQTGLGTVDVPTLDFGLPATLGVATPAAVPEPGSLMLAGCGALALAWCKYRCKRG